MLTLSTIPERKAESGKLKAKGFAFESPCFVLCAFCPLLFLPWTNN